MDNCTQRKCRLTFAFIREFDGFDLVEEAFTLLNRFVKFGLSCKWIAFRIEIVCHLSRERVFFWIRTPVRSVLTMNMRDSLFGEGATAFSSATARLLGSSPSESAISISSSFLFLFPSGGDVDRWTSCAATYALLALAAAFEAVNSVCSTTAVGRASPGRSILFGGSKSWNGLFGFTICPSSSSSSCRLWRALSSGVTPSSSRHFLIASIFSWRPRSL